MNSKDNSNSIESHRQETVSRFLSSIGCSWNTNDPNCCAENSTISIDKIPFRRIYYPSFSLTDRDEQDDEKEKEYDSDASLSQKREAVQSKASKLMSRKRVFSRSIVEDKDKQVMAPQRIMLENILDSFDRLVDARIRAYARILSNHVRVLLESNNTKGAQIAEYKLHTLLEVATNHLLFDSISTRFNALSDADVTVCTESTTLTTIEKEKFATPIELTVEMRSPRFFFEGLETINRDGESTSHKGHHGGRLIFRSKGKLRGDCFTAGQASTSNDTDSCLTPEIEVCRNSKDSSCIEVNSFLKNIEIEIDCETLLSQMMEEASKVVTMAVELTNLAWANNIEKQEEINKMNMVAEESRTANIIVDDDDLSTSNKRPPTRMTGKRSRDDHNEEHQARITISKQVSEVSFCPPAQLVCDEEHVKESPVCNEAPSSVTIATITNLHVLERESDRKTRYFNVSDPSYASSSAATDHDYLPEKCPHDEINDEDECYNMITAERACDIVDFVLAGHKVPYHFSPSKKLRTK